MGLHLTRGAGALGESSRENQMRVVRIHVETVRCKPPNSQHPARRPGRAWYSP